MFALATKPAFLISVALAAVAAVVGGAILFTSSKASEVDLTALLERLDLDVGHHLKADLPALHLGKGGEPRLLEPPVDADERRAPGPHVEVRGVALNGVSEELVQV